jgi:hypothetical protein
MVVAIVGGKLDQKAAKKPYKSHVRTLEIVPGPILACFFMLAL